VLEEIEVPTPEKNGYLGCFEKYKAKFEQIASSSIAVGWWR
jgi:hypothetical protein